MHAVTFSFYIKGSILFVSFDSVRQFSSFQNFQGCFGGSLNPSKKRQVQNAGHRSQVTENAIKKLDTVLGFAILFWGASIPLQSPGGCWEISLQSTRVFNI